VSVPSPSEAQATFAATIIDEWIALGVSEAVLCPGSRSTPLALALSARDEITLHVRIDERSAAFFAIGRALATGRATIIVVTSGTAAAELHAAVAEADQAGVPLIVVTADRPPELHGVGAPQTIDQQHLYGTAVRCFVDLGVARYEDRGLWRQAAADLWTQATYPWPGPVHLNAPFVEPLVATSRELPESGATLTHVAATPAKEFTPFVIDAERVLVVAGAGSNAGDLARFASWGWVVVGDATRMSTTPYADAIMRGEHAAQTLRPDVVVRVGGLPASKVLAQRLREWAAPVVGFVADNVGAAVADPDRIVTDTVHVIAEPSTRTTTYREMWARCAEAVEATLDHLDLATSELNEPAVARALVRVSSETAVPLVVGSSMPFRDVEWWSPSRSQRTFANRGVNGIDGVNSTVMGVASQSRAIGFVGDVTFLHDVGSLSDGLGPAGGSCALVVADNSGGGIFSFLPQAEVLDAQQFSRLFTTPRRHDLAAIAESFGHRGVVVSTVGELESSLREALDTQGLSVIVARVPEVTENVAVHDALNEAAIAAVRAALT
jgi:2-succinyl-5-enolpyruvyl-6-hydroxy-3-cyclohexene-1-carboxylate synthase